MSINFGPQHPAAHGVLRLVLLLEGEVIKKADPHIGLLHRGTEKLLEYRNAVQGLPYVDRLDYVSMMVMEHAYSLAIERSVNIRVHRRYKLIRILVSELTRILNHLLAISTHAMDVGALTPFLWAFEEREKLMNFYEMLSGARMHAAYVRPGGVASDIPAGFFSSLYKFLQSFSYRIDEIEDMLTYNRIWYQRLRGVGEISVENALNYGFTGPMLRGTGLGWDLRYLRGYDLYNKIKFFVPVGLFSDCLDRYLVRVEEMRQSITISSVAAKYILEESFDKDYDMIDNKKIRTKRGFMKHNMESLIHHFKMYTEGIRFSNKDVYISVEAPKGEFGVYYRSEGESTPYRARLKAPGFLHLAGLDFLSKNEKLADVVAIIGTLDVVFGEIDR